MRQGGGGRGPEEEAIRGRQEVEVRSQGKRDREQEAGAKTRGAGRAGDEL